jgi:hypothetical protein
MSNDRFRHVLLLLILLPGLFAGTAQANQRTQNENSQSQGKALFAGQDAPSVRNELRLLFTSYPPTVLEILQRDPSLMSNEQFMTAYPRLGEFLETHPEVLHNPAFFLGRPDVGITYFEGTGNRSRQAETFLAIMAVAGAVVVLIWVIRTVVEHRRWLRVSRLQNEAHTKIMDRFSSNEELLNFIQTPAGKRFLESSIIPSEPRGIAAPIGRILSSVQAGLVLFAGGAGVNLVSGSITQTGVSEVLSAVGAVLMAVGAGFIVSGVAAYFLSRRFGLFDQTETGS